MSWSSASGTSTTYSLSYMEYYNDARTHPSLNKDAPVCSDLISDRDNEIKHMVLAFWSPQQVKCPEALDLVETRLTRHPQILEGFAFLLDDLETVHGDEHF